MVLQPDKPPHPKIHQLLQMVKHDDLFPEESYLIELPMINRKLLGNGHPPRLLYHRLFQELKAASKLLMVSEINRRMEERPLWTWGVMRAAWNLKRGARGMRYFDDDNLQYGLKGVRDGFVEAGLFRDDNKLVNLPSIQRESTRESHVVVVVYGEK